MAKPKKTKTFDYGLLVVVILLIVIGLYVLYSTSSYNGRVKFQDAFYYLKKQIFAVLIGILGMYLAANTDYHCWERFSIPVYVVSILLSVAVLLIGDEYNGSKRWLSLG